jgi:hypothetical protein
MKKSILLLLFAAIGSIATLRAQTDTIPNNGFEHWTGNTSSFKPIGWDTIHPTLVTRQSEIRYSTTNGQSFDHYAHDGTYFAQMQSKQVGNLIYFAGIKTKYPFTSRPAWFSFYAGYLPTVAQERFYFQITSTRWNDSLHTRDTIVNATLVAGGTVVDPWNLYKVDLRTYYKTTNPPLLTPDSMFIEFISSSGGGGPAGPGTILVVDNMQFSADEPVGIAQEVYPFNQSSMLSARNYPNPFNDFTNITYTLLNASTVDLSVYDITGRQVMRQSEGMQGIGEHNIVFKKDNLQNGIYFYRLNSGGNTFTGKMMISK